MTDATVRTAHAFDDELARLDATATAAAVRSGDLSPAESIAAAIARAERLEPELRAIATPDFDRARAAAAAADASGPFAGVPTFVKDMTDVAGLPTRNGSGAFAHAAPATKTFAIAQQLLDMGTVCLGKSSLPEFGFTPSTEFPDGTATHNPWNLGRSVGGSSGGAAALVASGVVPIAHGQDGGGSIRIPAACAGLVGLKASRGRLVTDPHDKLMPVQIVVDGVVTRSVRDTAAYFAEAEARFRNPKLPAIGHVRAPLARPLRIGAVIDSPIGVAIDPATRATFEATIALLEELGHHVEPMDPPVGADFAEDFIHYWSSLAWAVTVAGRALFDPSFDKHGLADITWGLGRRFRSRWRSTVGAMVRLRRSAQAQASVFDGIDAFLSPTIAHLPPPLGHLGTDLPFDVLFPRVEHWVGFTPLANATGAPAISLPLGHDAGTNLPVGMMFSAATGRERLLLELALALEEARPFASLADLPAAPPAAQP